MPYNILIVDDSKVVRAFLVKALRLSQIELGNVVEAENGREALAHLEEGSFDLVIADLNMPVMKGAELVEEMAERKTIRETPVIIVTTDRSSACRKELEEKGVSGYLTKPFTPESVRSLVESVLRKKAAFPPPGGGSLGSEVRHA